MWNLKYVILSMNLSTKVDELIHETGRLTDIENRLVVAKEMGVGEGWTGSLGSADANNYI